MINDSRDVNFPDRFWALAFGVRFSPKIQRLMAQPMSMRPILPLVLAMALAACGEDSGDRLVRAKQEIASLELVAARVDLLAALEAKGDDPEVLRLLAQVQLRLGDGDGASATALRMEQAGVGGVELSRIRAEAALLRGNADEALSLLGSDSSPQAERVRAGALMRKQDTVGALAALRRGSAQGGDALVLRDHARFLIDAQDIDGAAEQVTALSRLQPEGFDALMLGADIAARRGRFAEAHALLEKAATRYPRVPDPWIARATVYDLEGKLDQAIAMTGRAQALAPDDPRVRDLKVQFAAMKGEWDKVRTILAKQERDLDPLSANGLSYAEAMLRTGHPEQARALFQRALTRSPSNPYSRLMLAESQLATGDARAALSTVRPLAMATMAGPRELELAVKAADAAGSPEVGTFKSRLAQARDGLSQRLSPGGQAALAREDWSAAASAYGQLAQLGEDAEVLKRLAFALSNAGKPDEAIRAADRARALRPEDPDTAYMAGLVRAKSGRDAITAVALLREASEAAPENPVFRRALARYQGRTGA